MFTILNITLAGVFIGVTASLAIGPGGLILLTRSLRSTTIGLATAIGLSAGDGVLGVIASFGNKEASLYLNAYRTEFIFCSSGFLLAYALFTLWNGFKERRLNASSSPSTNLSPVSAFGSAMLLVISNPIAVLVFASASTSGAIHEAAHFSLLFGLAVFVGSGFVHVAIGLFAHRLGPLLIRNNGLRNLHVASGALIGLFGVSKLLTVL